MLRKPNSPYYSKPTNQNQKSLSNQYSRNSQSFKGINQSSFSQKCSEDVQHSDPFKFQNKTEKPAISKISDNVSSNKSRYDVEKYNNSNESSKVDSCKLEKTPPPTKKTGMFGKNNQLNKNDDFMQKNQFKLETNETRISNRGMNGHLVSINSISANKQSKFQRDPYENQNQIIDSRASESIFPYDKQNQEPNQYQLRAEKNYLKQTKIKTNPYNPTNIKIDYNPNLNKQEQFRIKQPFNSMSKPRDLQSNKSEPTKNFTKNSTKNILNHNQQDHLLIPIINTSTGSHNRNISQSQFNSNNLSQSSISSIYQSSRLNQQNQITYLKQKLIQTHTKLIKEVQISKQLEENFFQLKKKYEQSILMHKKAQQMYESERNQTISKESQLNDKLMSLNGQVSQLTSSNKALKEEIYQLKQTANCLSRQNESMKAKSYQNLIKQRSLQQQLQKLKTNKYSSRQLKQLILKKQYTYDQKINEQKRLFDKELEKIKQFYHTQAQEQKFSYFEQIQQQNQLVQRLQKQKQILNQKVERQRQKTLQLKNDLENMRNKVLELNKFKQEKQEQIEEIKKSANQLQIKQRQVEDKLSKRDKQFNEKQQLCEIWRKKYSQIQEQLKKVSENIFQHQKEQNQTKQRNSELTIALRQQKQKNAQMLSEIINIQMENKQLKAKIQNLQTDKKQLQDKLFEVTPQKNTLHQKQQMDFQIQKLTEQYNNLSSIINKKDRQISQLKNQLIQTNSFVTKLSLKEKQLCLKEKEIDEKSRQLQFKQKNIQEEKITKINSVKQFVNRLQENQDRSLSIKRSSHQPLTKQNVFNNSQSKIDFGHPHNSRQKSPVSPKIGSRSQETFEKRKQNYIFEEKERQREKQQKMQRQIQQINYREKQKQIEEENQNFGQLINQAQSKSLSGLKVKNVTPRISKNSHQKMEEQNDTQDRYVKIVQFGLQKQQNLRMQYQSYEDSLQVPNDLKVVLPNNKKNCQMSKSSIVNQNNHSSNPKNNSNSHSPLSKNKSCYVTPNFQNVPEQNRQSKANQKQSLAKSQTGNQTETKSKNNNKSEQILSSYKQQKQQYLSILEEIGDLETQSYNLGQQKSKILDELDKIQNTKIKTNDIINRRRQLELRLLGNQKKSNQIKNKLKIIRGQVV